MAFGAFAFDVAVGQEHVFFGVEKLFNGFGFDQRTIGAVTQVAVDLARQLVVFGCVSAVPVIKTDVKTVQVLFAPRGNVSHKLLRCFARFFCSNHDGRTVGIVCPYKINGIALHSLEAHPNIGLNVLHDVTDVKIAIGIGQCGGYEELAWIG